MTVEITLTLTDLIAGAAIIIPITIAGVHWAIRAAVRYEVASLELRIANSYMRQESCERIRAECERHRHEVAARAKM